MRAYTVIASLAAVVSAAPVFPELNLKEAISPDATLESLSDYFNTLATRVQLAKVMSSAPECDLSKAKMPSEADTLPAPGEGLVPKHIAVGRGTQNYTCSSSDANTEPEAAGALATLFDASCVAALYPDLLDRIPGMALAFNISDAEQLGASPLPVSGHHYFTDPKTPYFTLNTDEAKLGETWLAKNSSSDAPTRAAVGQDGEGAVAWLKLDSKAPTTGGIKAVYRVTTAGGSPPKNCEGMAETFEVQYSSVYWFWADPSETDEGLADDDA
ncbi:hypothetical protein N3K66_002238 [Trichothecium roseum]|uniref:Uncharacterized protein n=1 Tax=Trichothecium roseum TaxID=47278 RepID=A0ACC0VAG0_9HYPO|nr:hypothetical protein N3K66_002238 [Trichothecium roseum]